MILQSTLSGKKITVSHYFWCKHPEYRDTKLWKDITPSSTPKQIKQRKLYVERGILERAKANLKMALPLTQDGVQRNFFKWSLDHLTTLIKVNQVQMTSLKNLN